MAYYYNEFDNTLESITIPEGYTSIDEKAFYKFDKLTNITIPNSIKKIGKKAFKNCSSLSSIDIPNSVSEISEYDSNSF